MTRMVTRLTAGLSPCANFKSHSRIAARSVTDKRPTPALSRRRPGQLHDALILGYPAKQILQNAVELHQFANILADVGVEDMQRSLVHIVHDTDQSAVPGNGVASPAWDHH